MQWQHSLNSEKIIKDHFLFACPGLSVQSHCQPAPGRRWQAAKARGSPRRDCLKDSWANPNVPVAPVVALFARLKWMRLKLSMQVFESKSGSTPCPKECVSRAVCQLRFSVYLMFRNSKDAAQKLCVSPPRDNPPFLYLVVRRTPIIQRLVKQ